MTNITTPLILEVSDLLLERWKNKNLSNIETFPDTISLGLCLMKLLSLDKEAEEEQSLTNLFENAKKSEKNMKVLLKKIEESVSKFQMSIRELNVDGILGTKTVSAILEWHGCLGIEPKDKKPLDPNFRMEDATGAPTNDVWFLYFIEEHVQNLIPHADEIIEQCWGAWKKVALIRSRRVYRRELANVIIGTKDLKGSILGESHVGPVRNDFILELLMDSSRNWTKDLFKIAMIHEQGHILGLEEHSAYSGNAMSESIGPEIKGPMPEDIARARDLPFSGPPPQPVTETQSDSVTKE